MASSSSPDSSSITIMVCIKEALTDDELRSVLAKLESQRDKEVFGFVCKRWLHLQSTERKRLSARAGPHMLRKMAARFFRVLELDLSQSISRSFFRGVTDSDLVVITDGFKCLRLLNLQNCKGISDAGVVFIGSSLPSLVPRCVRLQNVNRQRIISCFRGLLRPSGPLSCWLQICY